MRSLYIGLGASALAAIAIAWAVNWFVSVDRDRRELDDLRDFKEGTEDARDALENAPVDVPSAVDRLRGCANGGAC